MLGDRLGELDVAGLAVVSTRCLLCQNGRQKGCRLVDGPTELGQTPTFLAADCRDESQWFQGLPVAASQLGQ